MLLFLSPRLNSRTFANNKASSGTTSGRLNLQHEPIQPMPPAEGLAPAKVTLGDADAINNGEKEAYHRFKTYDCIVRHQGRFNVTGDKAERDVFRVPSLHLTALTSPYLHDASIKTLKQDITCIVKFQKTLPGEYKRQPLCKEHKPQKTNNKS